MTRITCFNVLVCTVLTSSGVRVSAQTTNNLEEKLKAADVALLAKEVRRRGDPKRGAFVFYTSAAGCAKCHLNHFLFQIRSITKHKSVMAIIGNQTGNDISV